MPENTPQPFDAAALNDDELSAEHSRIQTRGAELAAQDSLTDEESAELTELASRADAVGTEQTARTERANALSAARDRFTAAPVEPAPAAPETIPAPVIEPTQVTPAAQVPSVAELAVNTLPTTVPTTSPSGSGVTAFVSPGAAGFVGKDAGKAFSGMLEIAEAQVKIAEAYGRRGGKGSRHAVAQLVRDRGEDFTVTGVRNEDGYSKLQATRRESRLYGGSLAKQWQYNIDQGASLTAAAGWCAPSENRYDLCQLWGAGVGLLDLPTITVRRGGLNYTDEPTFADIYANAVAVGGGSNFLTEAQVIADTAKTCSELPCPTFENRRLDVLALCIRVGLLQAAGYPELVALWNDGLLAANEQEMNRIIIADMVTRAGAATVVVGPDPDGGDSFTSALLAAVELAAEDTRYREGMPWNATIEIVLPHWVIPQIRADLSRRNGVDLLSVSDSQIASLFSTRGVRVQFVRGYQDGLITGGALAPTLPGGDATAPYLTALPSTVNFLSFPAGSVAVARQDVITLTNVYDAASLATNEFTSLFAEEGFAPVYPCGGLRQYTVAGCVGGVTGATSIDCVDATP